MAIIKKLIGFKGDNGKDVIKDSRVATIKKKSEPYKNIYELNSRSETFANWYYERKLLGYSHCVRLKTIFDEKRAGLQYIEDVNALRPNQRPVFIGVVEDIINRTSKNGNKYMKASISDETGIIDCLMFNDNIKECETMNNGLPEKGNIVIIKGNKKEDAVFANLMAIQDNKVYTKLSELKNS